MLPVLATWKISCVVRTYVILARARGSRATNRRHQQRIAERRSTAELRSVTRHPRLRREDG
jgi:hypothetical protein